MTEPLEQRIIDIVQAALNDDGKSVTLSANDSMETIAEWDSVSFMKVFLAINEAFGLSPDFDDAIHYTSVQALLTYIQADQEA